MASIEETRKQEREQEWRKAVRDSIKPKDRMAIERVKMTEADAEVRSHSYVEVNEGLTLEQASQEAKRCLDCPTPLCVTGCPVEINIPTFIKHLEAGKILEAAGVIKETSSLPAVCGRVCPQEKQCESKCIYNKTGKKPVAIGYLERFVADYERNSGKAALPKQEAANGVKVAVVGSGPAGLTCAGELAKKGYDVTVFEALHEIGGVLKYGIPEFRLPNDIVDFEINNLRKMGVKFEADFIVGKTATMDDLRAEGFKAFFVGSGAGLPRFMNIPGENYNGIMSSNEYLTRVNLMHAADEKFDTPVIFGKKVAVIGGGNTAMDSVRTARRLGAERVMLIYRRSEAEMPARLEEVHHAKEEGVEFHTLCNPVEYMADEKGNVCGMKVQRMELGEPDEKGRRKPVPIPGAIDEMEVDLVVVSVGVSPNPLIPDTHPDIKTTERGTLEANDGLQTSVADVFAGGDIVRGGATVILAMGDGRKAAASIDEYLKKN
ncbi:MAG: NADPH-dependent glutamate synthase [Bacteroidales bacterium]|nr:NADPH-dependent glutamate synthase [Bacteroidales bacterium]